MTIAFYKFKCILDENSNIYCKYDLNIEHSVYQDIVDTLEDLSEAFPIRFIFCNISNLPETWIQIFILRNTQLYEVIRREHYIILLQPTSTDSE